MKNTVIAFCLTVGSSMLTFSALSFALFPRQLSLSNPTLLVEAIGISGAILLLLGLRKLFSTEVQVELSEDGPTRPMVA